MGLKPFTFGIRLHEKGRTVRVRQDSKQRGYVVEDQRKGGGSKSRRHSSLGGAVRDAAVTWRGRLN